VGAPPQDKKFEGGETRLEIGDRTIIRESATLHLGTEEGGGVTRVGADNLVMAYVHVAHDCQVGDQVVLSNAVTLAGHVEVGDHAIIGGMTAVHQFCRIGTYAFIGGASAISKDVPPYASAAGNRARLYGLNTVGLDRAGFAKETVDGLKRSFKALFHRKRPRDQALAEVADSAEASLPEVQQQLALFEAQLAETPQLAGHAFSAADLYLAPVMAYLAQTPEAETILGEAPHLSRWWETVQQRPSFAATAPG